MKAQKLHYEIGIGAKYGLMAAMLMILVNLIPYIFGLSTKIGQWPLYIYYLGFISLIILAIRKYKRVYEKINLKTALTIGFSLASVSGLLFSLYDLFFNYLIDPAYSEMMTEAARKDLEQNSNLSAEEIEALVAMHESANDPINGIIVFLLLNICFGLFYSIIVGLIFRRKNRPS